MLHVTSTLRGKYLRSPQTQHVISDNWNSNVVETVEESGDKRQEDCRLAALVEYVGLRAGVKIATLLRTALMFCFLVF